jgi:hypothetical protein
VPLADVKRAAKSRGASVTDFVMATSSGALRRLLLDDRGEALRKDLVAFVPINVRKEGAASDLGNQISGMLSVCTPTSRTPEERLAAIAKDSRATVSNQREHNAKVLQNIPRVLGPMALSFGGKMVSAFGLMSIAAHRQPDGLVGAGSADSAVDERLSGRLGRARRTTDRKHSPSTSRSSASKRTWNSGCSVAPINARPRDAARLHPRRGERTYRGHSALVRAPRIQILDLR